MLREDDKIPGDAEATENHAATHASVKMFDEEPCTIQSSIQLKYPVCKNLLVKAYQSEMKKTKFQRTTVRERAECMRRILENVALGLGQVSQSEQGTAHDFLGKRVSRVQGPVQFLRAYGIIIKVTKAWTKKQERTSSTAWKRKVIRVGKDKDTQYRVCATLQERSRAVGKLELMVIASPVIQGLVRNCPDDLKGMRRVFEVSFGALAKIKAPMLTKTADDYNRRWTCRGATITGLGMRGLTLQVGNATVGDLMACFPDVGKWLNRLSRHFYRAQNSARVAPLKDLLRKLHYTSQLEHFFHAAVLLRQSHQ